MLNFFGCYNVSRPDIEVKLLEMGFKTLYSSNEICFYCKGSEDDHSPLFASEDDVYLLFFGNVINIDEYCREFKPSNDQAFYLRYILDKYRREGDRTIDQMDGSFALSLWDETRKRLFLCRDDWGTKLLYYSKYGKKGLIFSNDLGELVNVLKDKKISKKALFEYLRFLDISPPYTIHENMWLLEPEKVLSIDSNGIKIRRKEKIEITTSKDFITFEDILCEFEKIFSESVRKRLMLSSNAGVFLSGGIDSSLVCAVAANMNDRLKALTVGFDDPKYDESPIARNIANYLGIDHEVLVFDLRQDYETFFEFTATIPSPFADPAIIPTFQCFRHIGGDIHLMIDGTGADTLSGIMPARYVHFILNYSRHIPALIRSWIARVLNYNKILFKHVDLFCFEDAAEVLIRWEGWSRKEISSLCGEPCDLSHTMFYQIYRDNVQKSPYELYSILMGTLPDERIHQSSSIFGPEVAFPFFDRNVQSYVRKLPLKYRYHKGKSKILFRALLGKYIPERIWDKPKRGFDYPFEKLLRYRNCELVHIYLSTRALKKHGLFEIPIINQYISRFLEGDNSVKFKIWALVMFQAWYENYYEKL